MQVPAPDAATPPTGTDAASTADAAAPDAATSCDPGRADCNQDRATDGCEVDLATDVAHCGKCDNACPTPPNGTATCANGSCGVACLTGYTHCDPGSTDACETHLDANPDHCGECTAVCSSQNMATRTCGAGTCDGTCVDGFADCNGDKLSDGCETPVSEDVTHCGGCNVVCAGVVGRGCVGGVCNATCDDGLRNQGERDVDCGGPCAPCDVGSACADGSDCRTGECRASVCSPVACAHGYGLPGPPRIEAQEVQGGVTVGDFDGDGHPDVAITNATKDTVTVALGLGGGMFGPSVHYKTGGGPRGVAAGDLDGDGRDDLIVSNTSDATFSVLAADGVGGFATKVDYANTPGPGGIAVGDVDGDGHRDLAIAFATGVAVRLNNGDGTFGAATNYGNGTGGQSLAVAMGDIDADGTLDLAVTSKSTGVTVLLNAGDGTFGAATAIGYSVGDPLSVAVVDMNTDGRKDVVASRDVFLQAADGSFSRPGPFDPSITNDPVAVADFDGDGKPDLGGVVRNPANVYIRLNDGSGATTVDGNYKGGTAPNGVVARDLDGNGFPDLVVINEGVAAANILLNYGGAKFATRTEYQTGIRPTAFSFGDVNGDGRLDVMTTSSNEFLSSANTVSVLINQGGVSLAPAQNYATGKRPTGVATGDFDGDGHPDIATSNWDDKTVSVLRNLGDGKFVPFRVLTVGSQVKTVLSADFDGDGRLDLIADTPFDVIRFFHNLGGGDFAPTDLVAPGTYFPYGKSQALAIGDLNGDGHPDVVRIQAIFTTAGVTPTVARYINRGDGTFPAPTLTYLSREPLAITTADLSNTGQDQYLLLNSDDTMTAGGSTYPTGLSAQTIAVGRIDGDGILDVVVGAGAQAVDVFFGKPGGGFASRAPYSSIGGEALGLVDFDGDGRSEVLTGNGSYIDVLPNVCLP